MRSTPESDGERNQRLVLVHWVREAMAGDDEAIHNFNSVMMPRLQFIARDPDGLVHLVRIKQLSTLDDALGTWDRLPKEITHLIGFAWIFDPTTGLWHIVKDRTGVYESLSPIKFQTPRRSSGDPQQR
jgi:hypothetical protein